MTFIYFYNFIPDSSDKGFEIVCTGLQIDRQFLYARKAVDCIDGTVEVGFF
jgi:hypothetical protein